MNDLPLLTLMLLMPAAGTVLIALLPGHREQWIRRTALGVAAATLVGAWSLLAYFEPAVASIQLLESHDWNPRLGTAFALGLDGFSYPMVLLATLLCLIALLASGSVRQGAKGYYGLVLVLESAMLGVFMARDWSLFYVFWELTLIPLFFLINHWGGKNRQGAALNFVLYTMGGSVFMLIGLLVLFDAVAEHSFSMAALAAGGRDLDKGTQLFIFLGFLIGFGVKMPIFPIHGWLPLAHVEAPSPISILLSGILLKMGSYGLIRAAQMLPDAVVALQWLLAGLAFVNLIYGGLLAWRQSDLKAMIAYSSISHMGVVLLGIATLNVAGLSGALMQMLAHGLVAGALFLLIGLLYERTHTREIGHYGSLVRIAPRFAFFTVFAFIAAVGIPGTGGFVAELHILVGGFQAWGWTILLLSIGVMIGAAYVVRSVGRLFTGPVRASMQAIPDLRTTESLAAGVLTGGVVLLGVFPGWALGLMEASVEAFSHAFRNGLQP